MEQSPREDEDLWIEDVSDPRIDTEISLGVPPDDYEGSLEIPPVDCGPTQASQAYDEPDPGRFIGIASLDYQDLENGSVPVHSEEDAHFFDASEIEHLTRSRSDIDITSRDIGEEPQNTTDEGLPRCSRDTPHLQTQSSLEILSLEDTPDDPIIPIPVETDDTKFDRLREALTRSLFERNGRHGYEGWAQCISKIQEAAVLDLNLEAENLAGYERIRAASTLKTLTCELSLLLSIPVEKGGKIKPIIQLHKLWSYLMRLKKNPEIHIGYLDPDDFDIEYEELNCGLEEESEIVKNEYNTKFSNFVEVILSKLDGTSKKKKRPDKRNHEGDTKDKAENSSQIRIECFNNAIKYIDSRLKDQEVEKELQLNPESGLPAVIGSMSSFMRHQEKFVIFKSCRESQHCYVVQFRGINLMFDRWTLAGICKYLTSSPKLALYSEAALHHEGPSGCIYLGTLHDRDLVISLKASQLKHILELQRKSGFIVAKKATGYFLYNNGMEFIQERYSNNISHFFHMLSKAVEPSALPYFSSNHECKSDCISDGDAEQVILNPMVSVSNQPKHALKYAAGQKAEWSAALRPFWYPDGRAQNRCVGVISVIISTVEDYILQNPDDVCSIANTGRMILQRLVAPEKEVSYLGCAPEEAFVDRTIVEYPSFHREWTPKLGTVFLRKYGIGRRLYLKIQAAIRENGKTIGLPKLSKNDPPEDGDAIVDFIEAYIRAFLCAKAKKMSNDLICEKNSKHVFIGESLTQESGTDHGPVTRAAYSSSQTSQDGRENGGVKYRYSFQLKSKAPFYHGSGNTGGRQVEFEAMKREKEIRENIGKGVMNELRNRMTSGTQFECMGPIGKVPPNIIRKVMETTVAMPNFTAHRDDARARFLASSGLE